MVRGARRELRRLEMSSELRMVSYFEFKGIHECRQMAAATVNISQMLARIEVRSDVCATVTPHGEYWLFEQRRLLHPVEMMRLQGIWFGAAGISDSEILMEYPDQLVSSLAGNAFETSSCAAALLVQMVVASQGMASQYAGCDQQGICSLPDCSDDDEGSGGARVDFVNQQTARCVAVAGGGA